MGTGWNSGFESSTVGFGHDDSFSTHFRCENESKILHRIRWLISWRPWHWTWKIFQRNSVINSSLFSPFSIYFAFSRHQVSYLPILSANFVSLTFPISGNSKFSNNVETAFPCTLKRKGGWAPPGSWGWAPAVRTEFESRDLPLGTHVT